MYYYPIPPYYFGTKVNYRNNNLYYYAYDSYTFKNFYYQQSYHRQQYSLGQPTEVLDVLDDPQATLITDSQQLQNYSNLLQVPQFVPLIVLNPEEMTEGYSVPSTPQQTTSPSNQYAGKAPTGYAGSALVSKTIWLFGFKVPEMKVETCHKVFKTPLGKFKIPYPCIYTRNSEIHFYATIWYPRSIEEYLKQKLNDCLIEAKGAAKGAGITAFISAWSGGPKAAAAAGLSAAFTAFKLSFLECIKSIPSQVRKDVYYQLKWEQIRISDWKRV